VSWTTVFWPRSGLRQGPKAHNKALFFCLTPQPRQYNKTHYLGLFSKKREFDPNFSLPRLLYSIMCNSRLSFLCQLVAHGCIQNPKRDLPKVKHFSLLRTTHDLLPDSSVYKIIFLQSSISNLLNWKMS
jgi:hypothetical protein